MKKIESLITFWLNNSKYLDEFKKYYDEHQRNKALGCNLKLIKEDFQNRGRTVLEDEMTGKIYIDDGMSKTTTGGKEVVKTGCYISSVDNGFFIELRCEYKGDVFTEPVYTMLNDFSGREYFTENLYIYDDLNSDHRQDVEKFVFLILDMMGGIQKYSSVFLIDELMEFYTKTDFIKEFLNLYDSISRKGETIRIKKNDIISIVEKCGYKGKYNGKERFCTVEKKFGNVTLGYNIAFAYDIVEFIPYGLEGDVCFFYSTSITVYIKMFIDKDIKALRYHSLGELELIISFMLKYLDVLGGYFIE